MTRDFKTVILLLVREREREREKDSGREKGREITALVLCLGCLTQFLSLQTDRHGEEKELQTSIFPRLTSKKVKFVLTSLQPTVYDITQPAD